MEVTESGRPIFAFGMRWVLHTPFRCLSLALVIAFLSASAPLLAAGQADILLHRQAPGRTFGVTSDTSYLDDFGNPSGALHADRFSLPTTSSICRVRAFVFFGGTGVIDPGPPETEYVRVRVFSDSAGLPGHLLDEENFFNPQRELTGSLISIVSPRREYIYTLPLDECFAADAGTLYWLEISQVGVIDSRFRWENSNTPGEFAIQFPIGTDWRLSSSGQLAYELWTPEPCSGALLALGLTCMFHRRMR